MAYLTNPILLIALVAVLATGLSITSPTFAALLPDMVTEADLPKATALGQTFNSIGMLAGPALAGVLVGQFGLRMPLLIDAATYLAVAVVGLVLRTRRNRRTTAERAPAAAGPDRAAWRLTGDRILWPLFVMIGAAVAGSGLISVAEVFFIRETIGASETVFGVVTAVWSGSVLIGSWLLARRQFDDGRTAATLIGVLAAICASFVAVGQVRAIGWVVALFAIGGLANGALNTGAGVLVARRVPAAYRGRAFASLIGLINGANMSAYLVSGVLLGWLAPETVITIAGVAGLTAVAALCGPLLRAIRAERAEHRGAPADPAEPVARADRGEPVPPADRAEPAAMSPATVA